jgi:outer membrane receptor for ferrienterochelin and colicin
VLDLRGPNSADFSNYVPKIINWGVSFARNKFSARVNWNQRGRTRLALQAVSATVPSGTYLYLSPRATVSADFEYRMSKRLSFSGTATNLTDTPVLYERYGPSTPDHAKKYRLMLSGPEFTLGIKGTF